MKTLHCDNCGAPYHDTRNCEYCGSAFNDNVSVKPVRVAQDTAKLGNYKNGGFIGGIPEKTVMAGAMAIALLMMKR